MATRYEETSNAWWVWLLYGVSVLFAVIAAYVLFAAIDAEGKEATGLWIVFAVHAGGAPLMALLARVFSQYRVMFDGSTLTFGFRTWNKSFGVGEIRSTKTDHVSLWTFTGAGWRVGRDGRVGYINTFGTAVEVETDARTYCFSCRDPDALVRQLRDAGVTGDSN